ncbi:MAG: thioredoxin family protein [Chitinophagaceae bacterium]|nr:thioredoxin family protein [Chitinophagaceae bacterium]
MKKIFLGFLVMGSLIALSFKSVDTLEIGGTMPKADVKMLDVSGKEVAIKDMMQENGILVMFSCNTCPYVIKNEARIKAINQYALEHNVGVIILNSNEAYRTKDDSFEAMQAYAKTQKFNWNYVIDKNHEIADAFGANRTPECFLFNNQMTLVYHGAIDDSPADESIVKRVHLKEAINELIQGKEVTIKESRSVGCSIKRIK